MAYRSLPLPHIKGWEAEGGFRFLYFKESAWLGTAGISKCLGNWLFNIRSFIGFQNTSDNQSYFVSARRYFNNGVDYAWSQVGSGVSPDESRNIQIGNANNFSSKRLMAVAKFSVAKKTQLQLSAGWFRNEYQKASYDNQLNTTSCVSQRF